MNIGADMTQADLRLQSRSSQMTFGELMAAVTSDVPLRSTTSLTSLYPPSAGR